MKYLNQSFLGALAVSAAFALSACSKEKTPDTAVQKSNDNATQVEVVKAVAWDTKPYSSLLEYARDELKKQNVQLEITYLTDSYTANQAVSDKQYDINYYQHEAYLDSVRYKNNWDLHPISYTFNTVFGGYSKKYKSVDELPEGATVTIPADPANNERALELLHQNKLIQLKEHKLGDQISQRDIIANPKKFKFVEVEQPMLPTAYNDSDLIVITGIYADRTGLVPNRDALIKDHAAKKWAAVLVANSESKNNPAVIKVQNFFDSKAAYDFIQKNYGDFIIWDKQF